MSGASGMVGIALVVCLTGAGDPVDTTAQATYRDSIGSEQPPSDEVRTGAVVTGIALGADGRVRPGVVIVLRHLGDGREEDRVNPDAHGAFAMSSARGGAFLIELHSVQRRLLAVTDPFALADGTIRTVEVRARAEARSFARFFRNSAAAAIQVASTSGITAMGSSGSPASPH